MLDVAVGGINLIHQFGDVDVALGVLLEALVERTLQSGVAVAQLLVVFPGFAEAVFQAFGLCAILGELDLRILIGLIEGSLLVRLSVCYNLFEDSLILSCSRIPSGAESRLTGRMQLILYVS